MKKVCLIHRYPVSRIFETNPAFPAMVKEFSNRDYKIFFISYKEDKPEKRPYSIQAEEINMPFRRQNKRDKLIKTFLFMILAPIKAVSVKRKRGIDLFYCDDSIPFYGFLTKILVGKTKVIIRMGDLQSGYNFADQGFIKGSLFKLSLFFERMMWKKLNGIVAISEAFKKFFIRNGVHESKVTVVEECVDLNFFRPGLVSGTREKYPIGDNPLVCFHGVLVPCKGAETLIKAAKIVTSEKEGVKFLVHGYGSEVEKYKKLVSDLNLENTVFFSGWVSSFSEVPRILSAANIGVVMRNSNLANNFVVTTCLLQYWALEKPIIVPNLEAMRGVVKEGENGLFFEPENEKDLAEKIMYLLNHRELWDKMGKNGRETVRRIFDKDLIGKKMAKTLIEMSA